MLRGGGPHARRCNASAASSMQRLGFVLASHPGAAATRRGAAFARPSRSSRRLVPGAADKGEEQAQLSAEEEAAYDEWKQQQSER